MSDTYTISDPDLVWGHGPCIGTITDALSGVTWACFRDGKRVPLDVPLCGACDAPMTDEPCECSLPIPSAGQDRRAA